MGISTVGVQSAAREGHSRWKLHSSTSGRHGEATLFTNVTPQQSCQVISFSEGYHLPITVNYHTASYSSYRQGTTNSKGVTYVFHNTYFVVLSTTGLLLSFKSERVDRATGAAKPRVVHGVALHGINYSITAVGRAIHGVRGSNSDIPTIQVINVTSNFGPNTASGNSCLLLLNRFSTIGLVANTRFIDNHTVLPGFLDSSLNTILRGNNDTRFTLRVNIHQGSDTITNCRCATHPLIRSGSSSHVTRLVTTTSGSVPTLPTPRPGTSTPGTPTGGNKGG